MCLREIRKKCDTIRPFLQVLLILLTSVVYPQAETGRDTTLLKIKSGSFLRINNDRFFIRNDSVIVLPSFFVNVNRTKNEKTIAFYDSLKSKASRTRLTRVLYDLVVVSPDTVNPEKINQRSDESFIKYSGYRVRSITIKQLDVFGGNIYNPAVSGANRIEKFINSTHINTNEKVLRRYLLFSEGDTISPLTITDNERILRQLPYIDDARIIVAPVSDNEADVIIITKDVYSLGADFTYRGINKGSVWIYDKNLIGTGQELKIEIPYSATTKDSPGIGINYNITNILKSFIDLNLNFYKGLGKKSFGFDIDRPLLSSETKYAFGISVNNTYTTHDLDTLPVPEPLKYNFQDYWLMRSFMIDRRTVSRLIAGIRYVNNNVFQKPDIQPDTYYSLQRYRLYLASLAFSMQKYYKTSLLYSFGRTEDIPYGTLINITSGIEDNEFKKRVYFGSNASLGFSVSSLGYFHLSAGAGTFFNDNKTEQGVVSYQLKFFSNLIPIGKQMIRNFVHLRYTGGFDRYRDEYLTTLKEDGFSCFANDSLRGTRRFNAGIESVIFNPINLYGFRFAFFTFVDLYAMGGLNFNSRNSLMLSGLGVGLRIRNDNLVFRTFQIRIGYFPYLPEYSRVNYIMLSGEQLLRPKNFEPGRPSLIQYR